MKKFIAVLLSLVIVITSCIAVSASGRLNKDDISDYPVIMVAGYSSSSLYIGDSPETGEVIWGLNMDEVLDRVLKNIAELGIGLGAMTVGNAEIIAATLGREINSLFEKMRCNPDGTSVYDVKRVVVTADETNSANLKVRFPNGEHRHEQNHAAEFEAYISDSDIYNFTCDFRMGVEACAIQLDELIQDVKKHSGKDKVNIFAVSHGGQVTATYLTLFGYKNDVDNAVLTIPAIGGAGIAYDALNACVEFDEECLIRFIEHGTCTEEDYNWLVKAQQLGFIDDILNATIPHIFPTLGYWGSLWDFVPPEKYEQSKKDLLDAEESALLIEKSDRFHYEIYPQIGKKLQECIDNGMNISIIAGTGNRIVTGLNENSDAIITTTASTGATTAPYGERFADGYKQINDCGGKNKISPDMAIDASTAYLPDNTWFVNGLFHGMTNWDYYTRSLVHTLLFTDNITDVYSDPEYPQFRDTSNPSSAVYAEFSGCEPGIINSSADSLVITNCCWENDVSISAIYCDGINLQFEKVKPFETLAPGESVELKIIGGEIPAVSAKSVSVTVYYTTKTLTPLGYRTQYFRIDNGDAVEKTEDFVSTEIKTPFDIVFVGPVKDMLRTLGLYEFVTMALNIVYYWINTVFAI